MAAGFLSRYLNGPLSYVQRHIPVNKMYSVRFKYNISFHLLLRQPVHNITKGKEGMNEMFYLTTYNT